MKMIKVKILSEGRIPLIGGTGPILTPITIPERDYNTLITLGYRLEIVKESFSEPRVQIPADDVRVQAPAKQAPVEEISASDLANVAVSQPVAPEPRQEEVIPEVVEAPVEEQEVIEETPAEEVVVEEVTEVPAVEEIAEEVTVEEVQEEVIEETPATEEVVEEEVAAEEVLVDDENLSGEAYYTYEFLTKKKAITILENRGVDFLRDQNAEPLKQMVLDTNPEIQE